jgi:trimeric autotransporter adhesin
MRAVVAISILFTLGLASCGGGGTSIGSPDWNPPASTSFRVSAQAIKTLAFRWEPVPSATHYRLFEDADGEAGPQAEQVIAEPPAGPQSFTLDDVFLPARVNARYRLQACNGPLCQDVARAGIEGIDGGIGYFKASNPAADDQFGEGLALSADGQLLAVGAPYEDGLNEGINSPPNRGAADTDVGAVYVFHRGTAGWVQEAYIKPAKALQGARFGYRVSLARNGNGHTLLVGSPEDSSAGSGVGTQPDTSSSIASSGAVYIFDRDALGQWTQTAYIRAQSPTVDARFGSTVSLSNDGTWAAVGHPDGSGGDRVSVYQRLPGGWTFRQVLQGSNTEAGDAFGSIVRLDPEGETLVVGAWSEDNSTDSPTSANNASGDSGAVYVFQRDGNNQWHERAYLKAPERRASGYFGYSVTLSSQGKTIVVGEPGDYTNSEPTKGRVHVFGQQGAGWVHETTVFTSPLPTASGGFGESLALSADGSTLAIANAYEDSSGSGLTAPPLIDPSVRDGGTVYLYRRTAAGAWTSPAAIKAPNNQRDLYFGWSLALSANGGTLAAYGLDYSLSSGIGGNQNDQSAPRAGAVYLY